MAFSFKPGIPYYYQIKEDLKRQIQEGLLAPGEKIPTENDLVKEYQVSRPTIRQALAELVQEGLLVRTRGRGTFVAHSLITDNARVFTTFMGPGQWESVTSQVIHYAVRPAAPNVEKALGLKPDSTVVELMVLLQRRNERLAYRTFFIPSGFLPDPSRLDFDHGPIFPLLQEEYGFIVYSAVQTFYAAGAGKEEARILEVRPGTPIMIWEGVLYTKDSRPLAYVRTVFRGASFHFTIVQGQEVEGVAPGEKLGAGMMDAW